MLPLGLQRKEFALSTTVEYTKEMNNIDEELFETPVMTQQMWKDCMETNRRIIALHAAHGFHYPRLLTIDLLLCTQTLHMQTMWTTLNTMLHKCINKTQ